MLTTRWHHEPSLRNPANPDGPSAPAARSLGWALGLQTRGPAWDSVFRSCARPWLPQ